jgi:GNAT superfamily N-acetyltransferase
VGGSAPGADPQGGVGRSGLPLPDPAPTGWQPGDAAIHPRVERALRYRSDVRVWASEHGVVILGRGLAGRWETAIEVNPASRNKGYGRALATAARHLVPDGRPVWGQIAPGNASSLRAFLAAGYLPVGSEVILTAFPPEAPVRHP